MIRIVNVVHGWGRNPLLQTSAGLGKAHRGSSAESFWTAR